MSGRQNSKLLFLHQKMTGFSRQWFQQQSASIEPEAINEGAFHAQTMRETDHSFLPSGSKPFAPFSMCGR
jgi:hypothetical protein